MVHYLHNTQIQNSLCPQSYKRQNKKFYVQTHKKVSQTYTSVTSNVSIGGNLLLWLAMHEIHFIPLEDLFELADIPKMYRVSFSRSVMFFIFSSGFTVIQSSLSC